MSEEGKLADFADLVAVDDWSRKFHSDFADWPIATNYGTWSTWAGEYSSANYLLLEIRVPSQSGELCEPIAIYSARDEITFATRAWHTHFPDPEQSGEEDSQLIKALYERWMTEQFAICVYYQDDAWKGSMTKDANEDLAGVRRWLIELRKNGFEPNRLEVRGPFPSKDRIYSIEGSSIHD